jgi:hypothetical protein
MKDERGSISIASVFALLILVLLLGLVVNVGRQVDRKVKLQNAADAATQSSGVVMARQMNSLAFTNHLLCDVFALTAGLREVQRDPPPPVSDARLAWLRSFANSTLPILEPILAEESIAQYQRTVLTTTPALAQVAADGIAQGHSASWPRPALARGAIWPAQPAVNANVWLLPVVDASGVATATDDNLLSRARNDRRSRARNYLSTWNREWLGRAYNTRRGRQWQRRTQRQLDDMLTFHSESNLPMLLVPNQFAGNNPYIDANFHFVGVVYVPPPGERIPGVFHQPFASAQQSYAELELFIPRNRLQWQFNVRDGRWYVGRQSRTRNPGSFDLWNQNWTAQLCPATSTALPAILSATPTLAGGAPPAPTQWRNLPPEYVRWLSHH